MKEFRQLQMLTLSLMALAVLACSEPKVPEQPEAPAREILKDEDRQVRGGGFDDLSGGGRLYAGTVESVEVNRREPDGLAVDEYGRFVFRVQKAVRGPFKKRLSLAYDTTEFAETRAAFPLVSDSGLPGNWVKRPKEGDELLLLLTPAKPGSLEDQKWNGDGYAAYIWEGVGPDHPLVKDFEVALRYLDATEESVRRDLFRKLCRSAWPSIRQFAQTVVFRERNLALRTDWPKESQLLGEYIKLAGPNLKDWERAFLTGALAGSFAGPLAFDDCCFDNRHPRRNPVSGLCSGQSGSLQSSGHV